MLEASLALNFGCEGKELGKSMLASVTVAEVVSVPITCPRSRDLWSDLLESGARAVSCRAWVSTVGRAEVLEKSPRQR